MFTDEISRELWNWERWEGFSGRWYARRRMTTPPVVIWAKSRAELSKTVRDYLALCHPYNLRPRHPVPISSDDLEAITPIPLPTQPPMPPAA